MKARKILVLNGPNLDMLGMREPEIYGRGTLESLEAEVRRYGAQHGVEVSCYQSNSEGKLVDAIHTAPGAYDAIVYNPGAHTHYSYALRDAVAAIDLPVIEVHLSDIAGREPFRSISVIAPACIAQVKGLGTAGYCRAIDILCDGEERERLGERFTEAQGENVVLGQVKQAFRSDDDPRATAEEPPVERSLSETAERSVETAGETPKATQSATASPMVPEAQSAVPNPEAPQSDVSQAPTEARSAVLPGVPVADLGRRSDGGSVSTMILFGRPAHAAQTKATVEPTASASTGDGALDEKPAWQPSADAEASHHSKSEQFAAHGADASSNAHAVALDSTMLAEPADEQRSTSTKEPGEQPIVSGEEEGFTTGRATAESAEAAEPAEPAEPAEAQPVEPEPADSPETAPEGSAQLSQAEPGASPTDSGPAASPSDSEPNMPAPVSTSATPSQAEPTAPASAPEIVSPTGPAAASEIDAPTHGTEAPSQAESTAPAPSSEAPSQTAASAQPIAPCDFTAPFANTVASVDAGLLSFERQAAAYRACDRLGIASLLVRDTSNVRWITALDGVFDEERAHALLIADGRAHLHTDSRYANAVRTAARAIGSDVVISDERTSHAQFAYHALTQGEQVALSGKLGIEDTITYAEFVRMVDRFGTDHLAPTTEVVLGLRAVKDPGEIVRMRAAQAVTDAAFSHIIAFMRPGMTEREVQLELEDFMMRHGAEGLAFRSIVATGENGADPHAIPGAKRLEAGQCVVMDFGAKAFGYCSDMTRTVFLGEPQGQMLDAWETLRNANEQVEHMLKPGVTGAQAHELAERVLAEGGFEGAMGHGLGHGVGLDVHELPSLNPRNSAPLVEGNVVTVEPGIYLPGRFGMRLEDFGVITATGFDVLTQSPHDLVVI